MRQPFDRREFLGRAAAGSAMVSLGAIAPDILCRAAEASRSDQRILVVVEMAGGNDGLNCVVPHSHDVYLNSRKQLRIDRSDTLAVTDELGLHPSLRGFADLLEAGHLAVVQGVGYPNPNRSHFESMDIWHSCFRKDVTRDDGWIGRYMQAMGMEDASDPPAIHLGRDKQPFALMSRDVRSVSIRSLDQFRFAKNQSMDLKAAIRELSQQRELTQLVAEPELQTDAGQNDLLAFVRSSTSTAINASDQVEQASKQLARSSADYPNTELGRQLQTVAKLIAAGMQTRIYYVRIDGFDTHANQAEAHAALLRDVSQGVTALTNDLKDRGEADRTLVMCFSEFGRRVAENASKGTDHGTAGPMFFAGQKLRSGLVGRMPSLSDLDHGDLKFHTDFRQVYAAVLKEWLECDPEQVLGGTFEPIELFS
ncbi:DUF1501 domain-containing protein [Planctomycetes bacterium K23_9]|uniref:DUF1501 domain-containing protein n=1 Tax=Stieleria marina TaxID=1930275 RepID=A0A517P3G8_9BACT|nr:hypothetical protein K239x_59280 [Planctomycetes bacterium K23_9]